MAFDRATGTWGPMNFVLSSAGTSRWYPIGPTNCNKLWGVATFTGTTGIVKIQGCLSTASTAAVLLVVSRTYAQRSAIIASTVNSVVAFLRANSTSLQAGKQIRATVAGTP